MSNCGEEATPEVCSTLQAISDIIQAGSSTRSSPGRTALQSRATLLCYQQLAMLFSLTHIPAHITSRDRGLLEA